MSNLKEIEFLVNALQYCSDESRYSVIVKLITESIESFSLDDYGKIDWLKTKLPNFGEHYPLEDVDFDKKLKFIIQKSANLGCKEAQYDYGCILYEEKKFEEAVSFYKLSADKGYPPAQWAYGIDRLNGIGIIKNPREGFFYIELAAFQGYEYAIEFLIDSYSEEKNGVVKNNSNVAKWMFIKSFFQE